MIATRDIHVRPATRADAPALEAILRDTFESTWKPQIRPEVAQAHMSENRPATFVAEQALQFWVAERDGEVVGLVHWVSDFINALHVPSRHARTGVGACLMDLAEAKIAEAGFSAVRLETDTFNVASQAFYLGRGYHEAGRYPDEEWHSGLTTVLYVRAITGASD